MPDPKKNLPKDERDEIRSSVSRPQSSPSAAPLDLQSELSQRRSRLQSLLNRASLDSQLAEIEAITTSLQNLPARIAELQQHGYRYGASWKERHAGLASTWNTTRPQLIARLNERRQQVRSHGDQLLLRLNRTNAASALPALDSELSSFDTMVREAEQAISAMYAPIQDNLNALVKELDIANAALEAFATATFPALPDEHPVAVVEARWLTQKDEGPRGLLIITDARLLFEQREKVATKKVLFITTAAEEVKKLLWQFPIGALQEVTTQDKSGFLSRQELLILRAEFRDIPPTLTLKLEGGARNEEWAQRIEMVRTGQIAAFATPGAEPTTADTIAYENAPTQCPRCGGKLPPVYKGMTQLTCEYCGTVVPLPRRS